MDAYYRETNANVHRGVYELAAEATARYEGGRDAVARLVGAPRESVVLTKNATEAINLVAWAWGVRTLKAGDEILVTEMEHHSNIVPWQIVAGITGATVRFVPGDPRRRARHGRLRRAPHRAHPDGRRGAREQRARHDQPGRRDHRAWPTRRAPWCWWTARRACRTCRWTSPPSAATSSPSPATRCSAPRASASWSGAPEVLEAMEPFLGGGEMISNVTQQGSTWADLPWKFEAGTPPIAEAIGLGAAADYLMAVGLDAVRAHEVELTAHMLDALARGGRHHHLRPARSRRPRRGGVVQPPRPAPARHRAADRPGGRLRARGPPLRQAADARPRRGGHGPGEHVPLQFATTRSTYSCARWATPGSPSSRGRTRGRPRRPVPGPDPRPLPPQARRGVAGQPDRGRRPEQPALRRRGPPGAQHRGRGRSPRSPTPARAAPSRRRRCR